MPARSKVKKLPDDLRAKLNELLRDGRHSVRDITEHLNQLGAGVSKSSVGRYAQDFERVCERIRATREMAKAVGKELGELSGGENTRLLVESLQALILRAQLEQVDGATDSGTILELARAVKDVQAALKSSFEMDLKVREQAAQQAAKAFEVGAKERGLSDDTVAAIRDRILGIAKA